MKKWLVKLARSTIVGLWIGWLFTHFSFVIPVKRLRETNSLLAFHHPQPSYPIHILIVPKRPYSDLLALETADTLFLIDLFQVVQSLVREFHLEQSGYRLITNGGTYQDVPHLHFHLVSGEKNVV
jgi:histidine triad (HIT) family protein